ncbi:MAG: hypothetical protein KBA72_12380 [Thermoanaerobaculia bacterium]|nr:hypothetical protein [Thermoanaerobaculia bacterium]
MGKKNVFAALGVAGLILVAAPAAADHHLMRIVQVYAGDVTHPDAQYVVLQMCFGGQNVLAGHDIGFFDAAGAAIGSPVAFQTNVASGNSQDRVFIATSSAVALFGVAADLLMPARILPVGGKLCFEPGVSPVDCFGWGNYSALPDPTIGTPFDAGIGITPGDAEQRSLSIDPDGGSSTLECIAPAIDDTNDSANDFGPTTPNPGNNAGSSGFINPNHVFLHGFESGASAGWSTVVP